MSKNYYAVVGGCENDCGHCSEVVEIHLGKSLIGWKFLLRADPKWEWHEAMWQWLDLVHRAKFIKDEYGATHSKDNFVAYVIRKTYDSGNRCHMNYYEEVSGDRAEWERHVKAHNFHVGTFDFCDEFFS